MAMPQILPGDGTGGRQVTSCTGIVCTELVSVRAISRAALISLSNACPDRITSAISINLPTPYGERFNSSNVLILTNCLSSRRITTMSSSLCFMLASFICFRSVLSNKDNCRYSTLGRWRWPVPSIWRLEHAPEDYECSSDPVGVFYGNNPCFHFRHAPRIDVILDQHRHPLQCVIFNNVVN